MRFALDSSHSHLWEHRIQDEVEESWFSDQADQVGLIDYALTSSVIVDVDTPDSDEVSTVIADDIFSSLLGR